jgi:hypothetical protein
MEYALADTLSPTTEALENAKAIFSLYLDNVTIK